MEADLVTRSGIIFRKWQNLHSKKERNWVIQNAWNQSHVPKPEAFTSSKVNITAHRVNSLTWTMDEPRPILSSMLADTGSTNKPPTNWAQKESAFVLILQRTQNWVRTSSPFPCAWKNTLRWAIPMLQGQEMDINWRRWKEVSIDPDIRRRDGVRYYEFCPSRISPHRPKLPRRMCVTSRQRKLDKKQSNNAVKIKRFRLCVQRVYGIVCLKGCLPSPR
jgi:hypothetical protein